MMMSGGSLLNQGTLLVGVMEGVVAAEGLAEDLAGATPAINTDR